MALSILSCEIRKSAGLKTCWNGNTFNSLLRDQNGEIKRPCSERWIFQFSLARSVYNRLLLLRYSPRSFQFSLARSVITSLILGDVLISFQFSLARSGEFVGKYDSCRILNFQFSLARSAFVRRNDNNNCVTFFQFSLARSGKGAGSELATALLNFQFSLARSVQRTGVNANGNYFIFQFSLARSVHLLERRKPPINLLSILSCEISVE